MAFMRNRHLATACFGCGLVFAMGFGVLWIQGEREKQAEVGAIEEEAPEPDAQSWIDELLASLDTALGASPTNKPKKVVIVFIQRTEAVSALREVVGADSLVFSDEEAIAMSSGRIVATDRDAASKVLNELNWIDLPMEMWDRAALGQRMTHARASAVGRGSLSEGNSGLSEEERSRYSELSNKSELSYMESRQLLQFMEKTGEI